VRVVPRGGEWSVIVQWRIKYYLIKSVIWIYDLENSGLAIMIFLVVRYIVVPMVL